MRKVLLPRGLVLKVSMLRCKVGILGMGGSKKQIRCVFEDN